MVTIGQMLASGGAQMALAEGLAGEQLAQGWPQAAVGLGGAGDGARYRVEQGVAVVPVRGILTPNSEILARWFGWSTYRGLAEDCAALAADEAVSDVVLELDSPGGMVLGLEEAAAAIRALGAAKRVHALVAPLAASAAYWLASQAGEISLTPGALVGSIGVAVTAARAVQPGASGMQSFEFTSPHARAKWPDPTSEAGRAEILRGLAESEARFHAAVAAGRGLALATLTAALSVSDDPADGGAVFGAEAAIARGLADREETAAAFFARIIGARPAAGRKGLSRGALAQAAAAQARARL